MARGRPPGSKNKPKDNGGTPPAIGGNGFDPAKVQSFVARIENLHSDIKSIMDAAKAQCSDIKEDISLVYDEAHEKAGIPGKALKSVLKARALERKAAEVREKLDDEIQETHDMIRHALGDLADTPLGQAALGPIDPDPDIRPEFLQRQEREREDVADMGDAPGNI
jgi:uncharacterized protein (UPF0335 family)